MFSKLRDVKVMTKTKHEEKSRRKTDTNLLWICLQKMENIYAEKPHRIKCKISQRLFKKQNKTASKQRWIETSPRNFVIFA